MSIQKKILYSILIIFTIVYSLSTWFYYIHFEKSLKESYKNQVNQINKYLLQDIKELDKRYKTLIKTLNEDNDVASLYYHIPWLVTISKKTMEKNFNIIFKRYPFLKKVTFYNDKETILNLESKTINTDNISTIKYEKELDYKGAKIVFEIDLIGFIQNHLKENNIQQPSFIYFQNKQNSWIINTNSYVNYTYDDISKEQIKLDKKTYILSEESSLDDFTLKSALSLGKIHEGLKNILYKFIIAYLFNAIAIFIIARYLSSFITKPLNSLENASKRIITGDFSKIDYKSEDETKNAILAFNLMSKEIQSYTKNLQEEVKIRTEELEYINNNLDKKIKKEVAKNQEQERLIFFQSKLATMGETINIIAHQWRQPISIVSNHLSNMQLKIEYKKQYNENELLDSIKKSQDGLKYISSTISLFQSYLKPKENSTNETFELCDTINRSIKLFDPILKKYNIQIIKNMPKYLKIKGNQEYFIQILMVLMNNSKDAIIKNKIENPFIKLTIKELENKIILNLEDNAKGIKLKENIFDPYISGKNSTGLGLFIAKNIIDKIFNGEISYENTKDGVKFSIHLPIKERD